MLAFQTLASNPEAVFILQTASILLLFYGLPSWLLYRVRAASWVSLIGAVLFVASSLSIRHGSLLGLFPLHTKVLAYTEKLAVINAAATIVYIALVFAAAGYFRTFPVNESA